MKIINAGYEILRPWALDYRNHEAILDTVEVAARTCYKSEGSIAPGSNARLVTTLTTSGHEAMLEHATITVRFTVDRGISHELVRHRTASFAQESTRYCNYNADKFGREITVIKPCFWDEDSNEYRLWESACANCERTYFKLLEANATPQEARSALPTSLKTEVVVTANLREWRHIFRLRTARDAHPQMREVMCPLATELSIWMPEVFSEIGGESR